MERLKDAERRTIPSGFEYRGIPGLSREVRTSWIACGRRLWGRRDAFPG